MFPRMIFAPVCLLLGISSLGAMTGYSDKLGSVPLWLALPTIAAIALIIGGSARFAWTLASILVGQGSTLAFWALGLGLFAVTIWVASMAVQLLQNFFRRTVGVPTERIRWWI
jgi:hypothetical protein